MMSRRLKLLNLITCAAGAWLLCGCVCWLIAAGWSVLR